MHRLGQQCRISRRVVGGVVLAAILIALAPLPAFAQNAGTRVPVLRQMLYPGQQIHAGMLAWRKLRRRANLTGVALRSDELIGKVARSTLLPNRLIYATALREPFLVDKGQIVGVYFKFDGIEIRGKGIAQQAGSAGALVQVQNIDSGRMIAGIVQGDGSVRVGGGS